MAKRKEAPASEEPPAKAAKEEKAEEPTETPAEEKTEEAPAEPKVLPKPSSPEELAHWNQMFFDLMVCLPSIPLCLYCLLVVIHSDIHCLQIILCFVCSTALQNRNRERKRQVNRQKARRIVQVDCSIAKGLQGTRERSLGIDPHGGTNRCPGERSFCIHYPWRRALAEELRKVEGVQGGPWTRSRSAAV